jgi:penicillin-binding protein 2
MGTDTLTIDPALQALADRLLTGKQGSIVALDPQTGEVKCLTYNSYFDDGTNLAISRAYSPGSTIKTAQALTLLSLGTVSTGSRYSCHQGFWRRNIHIGCHAHRSNLNLVEAIGHSCNSWFCKAFSSMVDNRTLFPSASAAIDAWHTYMESMGLGMPLGIDLPSEVGGLLPTSDYLNKAHEGSWNGTTVMWIGMGQGEVKCTPLQLCNLAALIGNRGYYLVPHTRKYALGDSLYMKYARKHQCLVFPETFDPVVEGMRLAITKGTAASINTPDYEICGKTGTAENDGEDHSIFIAFAPRVNPRIAICVYVENAGFGADLAAPIGALVIEQALKGKLSPRSEHKAKQWEDYFVIPNSTDSLHVPEVPMMD